MKNWFKKLSALAFTLALTMGLSLPAFADSDITFKSAQEGFAITSDSAYTDTDLFDGLKGAMPGDLLKDTVEITNEAADSDLIRVYLRAEPHDEAANPPVYQGGETVASMQDFLSQLTMRVYNGTELIYESSPDQPDELTENELHPLLAGGRGKRENLNAHPRPHPADRLQWALRRRLCALWIPRSEQGTGQQTRAAGQRSGDRPGGSRLGAGGV